MPRLLHSLTCCHSYAAAARHVATELAPAVVATLSLSLSLTVFLCATAGRNSRLAIPKLVPERKALSLPLMTTLPVLGGINAIVQAFLNSPAAATG